MPEIAFMDIVIPEFIFDENGNKANDADPFKSARYRTILSAIQVRINKKC